MMEVYSGFISPPKTYPGAHKLHPTARGDFIVGRGIQTPAQKVLGSIGRLMGTGTTKEYVLRPAVRPRKYLPHNCWPWLHCEYCNGYATYKAESTRILDIIKRPSQNLSITGTNGRSGQISTMYSFRLPGETTNRVGPEISTTFGAHTPQNRTAGSFAPTREKAPLPPFHHRTVQWNNDVLNPPLDSSAMGSKGSETQVANSSGITIESSTSEPDRFSTNDMVSTLIEVEHLQQDMNDVATVQQILEILLEPYQQIHTSLHWNDKGRDTNPFRRQGVIKVLREVFSDPDFYIRDHSSNANESEKFARILSTVESIVGNLESYRISLNGLIVEGQLSILVDDGT
jgi:hypothetical protein